MRRQIEELLARAKKAIMQIIFVLLYRVVSFILNSKSFSCIFSSLFKLNYDVFSKII